MVKDLLDVQSTCHLLQSSVLDFITGNGGAVQCVPAILKESHCCQGFCAPGALCSRPVPEPPGHGR